MIHFDQYSDLVEETIVYYIDSFQSFQFNIQLKFKIFLLLMLRPPNLLANHHSPGFEILTFMLVKTVMVSYLVYNLNLFISFYFSPCMSNFISIEWRFH